MRVKLQTPAEAKETLQQPLPSKNHEALFEIVCKEAKHSFDLKSGTHIFFYSIAPGMVPRGLGDYPDGAYQDFRTHAFDVVKDIQAGRVKSLIAALSKRDNEIEDEQVEIPDPRGMVQVGLTTTKVLHDRISLEAGQESLSANILCADFIARGFPALNKASMDMSAADVRKMIVGAKAPSGSEKSQWVVRISRELRARILVFANEYRLTLPQICVYLVSTGITSKTDELASA